MDSVVFTTKLVPEGKVGLVLGIVKENLYVYYLSKLPPVQTAPSDNLSEFFNSRIQDQYTVKNWIVEHAFQARKLIVPSFQILGLYTASTETIDKTASNPFCAEIAELLKKINKFVKSNILLHLHMNNANNQFSARIFDYSTPKNTFAKIVEKPPLVLVEFSFQIPVWIEVLMMTDKYFKEFMTSWAEYVENLEFRFEKLDGNKKLTSATTVRIYTKNIADLKNFCHARVKGLIHVKAKIPEGTSQAEAKEMLKKDLVDTFENRYGFLSENQKKSLKYQLPKRVFMDEGVLVCDYLLAKENFENSKSRLESILSISPSSCTSSELTNVNCLTPIYEKPTPRPSPASSYPFWKLSLLMIIVAFVIKSLYF